MFVFIVHFCKQILGVSLAIINGNFIKKEGNYIVCYRLYRGLGVSENLLLRTKETYCFE